MSKPALDGIRVVELGHVWAAPYCASALAELGAQVIKVESTVHIDIHRKQGPYPGKIKGMNRSSVWNAQNRGKLGVTLNFRNPQGVELAKQLIAASDIVVENFRPNALQKLGLDYESLKKIKPDLIMVSMTGYGQTGPFRNYAAYGPMLEAYAGVAAVTGYTDGPPACIGESYPDPLVGQYGVLAVLAALNHRADTGEGQYVDLSQLEAMMCHLPEVMMDYTMNETVSPRLGNHDRMMAPHACYRCERNDKWVAISVQNDDEWQSLQNVMGNPEWARDTRFDTVEGRLANQDELDRCLEQWTLKHTPYEVTQLLQNAGIAAGPSVSIPELLDDPHTRSRQLFSQVEHPEIGVQTIYSPTWGMSGTPTTIQRHAPLLGGDNEFVFTEILKLSPQEYENYVQAQAIY